MDEKHPLQFHIIYLKGMVCNCCVSVVNTLLAQSGIEVLRIKLGEVEFGYNPLKMNLSQVESLLEKNGFTVIRSKEVKLVESIKLAIFELVYQSNFRNSLIRNSDYLVDKLGLSYSYLSLIFHKHENITLEKYIIQQKIERVKQLIFYDEMSLSEIADMMAYSSVQYLSTQFKNVSGISVTDYKKQISK